MHHALATKAQVALSDGRKQHDLLFVSKNKKKVIFSFQLLQLM